ncbi:MAG TPA: TonB-dependent receptor plug domain-containing protein [Sediminibacterium sp.]
MKTRIFAGSIFWVCLCCISLQAMAQLKPLQTIKGTTYRSIFEMLRDVPGLEVTLSSDKTGGSVVVRGIGSFNNQKPPLFVVDGAIYSGDISAINPQDVDGISVLKDAASASAYGAQGAAGVILITTKKGQGVSRQAVVSSYNASAYTYFIEHKTPLKVFDHNDSVLIEGVIQKQQDSVLIFIKKRKEVRIAVRDIKRVEMIRE